MTRFFLKQGASHVQILPPHAVRDFRDLGAAREFLRPLLGDPRNVAAVRAALAEGRCSDAELLDALARHIVGDGLRVVSCADAVLAALRDTPPESAASEATPLQDEEAAQKTAAAEERHWIEIELVDDAGKPVANELYVIELPDGSSIEGRTGSDGRARVDGVDPGTAKVSFPDRDMPAYEPS